MRNVVFLALVLTVIVAGCAGSKTTEAPAESAIPTGDVNAASADASNIDSGIQGIESTNTELNSGISDADLNLGI